MDVSYDSFLVNFVFFIILSSVSECMMKNNYDYLK